MISIHRTILLLDHSPQARRKACYDNTKKDEAADEDSDDEFEPEPCSMWSSFVHAALQYSRLAWDLSPVGQKSQISVHVAPGGPAIYNSIILNAWTVQEQSLGHISYHLQELQHQEDAAAMNEQEIAATSKGWILLALQGAIAHILEPISQQPGSAPSAQTTPHHSSITANVIMVLTDMEDQPEDLPEDQPREGEEDTVMDNDMTVASEHDKGWRYGDLDIRKILVEALQTLQDALRSTKVVNIHVDFVRICTQKTQRFTDISKEQISRNCTASVYSVIAEDENSTAKALTNLYLLRHKDVQLLRLHNPPLQRYDRAMPIDLFYRTDHTQALYRKKTDTDTSNEIATTLQMTPRNVRQAIELDYGVECAKSSLLPTQCAHLVSISPSTFVSSFFSFVHGSVHLLKTLNSDDVASMALFDHDGQLFVHCLHTSSDPRIFSTEEALQSELKRKLNASSHNHHLEDFVNAIIRPNTITLGADYFEQEGNTFTEIIPSALKQKATFQTEGESANVNAAEDAPSSEGVNMALVHTTSKLDLETRWLVQWEGERIHPILPAHNVHIQKFKSAICKSSVDSAGLTTIQGVLDALIADARPLVLPGELPQSTISPQQQRFRESAQVTLADLWMIGQRFKSVSPSHVEAARLIATKITPKGLDHQTVKLTLVPPNKRAALPHLYTAGAGPNVDGGEFGGDGWNRNKGTWGVGAGRGGRGGRFDNNRAGRGGGPAGRGRGGSGGFRGGHIGNPVNITGGANNDDTNYDPSTAGLNGEIMVSMTGKTQPVPYLVTQPPTREEIEESEQEYLAQLGDDGCLLKAYWGSRGAQGSSIAAVLNSVTSLDSPSASAPSNPLGPATPAMDPLTAVAMAAQQKMKKLATKRPRLQDFAGRTPVSENGGYTNAPIQ